MFFNYIVIKRKTCFSLGFLKTVTAVLLTAALAELVTCVLMGVSSTGSSVYVVGV